MKQVLTFLLLCGFATAGNAQDYSMDAQTIKSVKRNGPSFGIKGGYNIARLKGSSPDYKPEAQNGFMIAGFFTPTKKTKGFGYRSEIVFSRQGFAFKEDGVKNDVVSDYIYIPQFTTFGISKFVQLQVGGQMGFLLKSSQQTEGSNEKFDYKSVSNKIDYGAAFGIELYPFKGIIIGGRYNMSFGNAYKKTNIISPLPFDPSDVKNRNAVMNFFVGYKF